MPKTLSLLAVLKKVDAKGLKSLSNAQWDTFLASDTEPNEIQEKIKKLEGYEEKGATYDSTGDLIVEDNQAMIDRFKARTGRASGRESLKTKRSKIDVKSFKEDFLNKKGSSVKADTTGTSSLALRKPSGDPQLPSSEEEDEEKNEETEGLKGIREVLDDILKILRLDFKDDRKEARDRKKEDAQNKRDKKEGKLEGEGKKSAGLIGKSVQAMVKPFSNIWDSIIKFLKFTLIGVLFNKTLSWFKDPKNEKKAQRVGKFFKDWWPALSAAALLFLTPFGSLVSGVIGLLTAIIPKLILAIAANPWAATAVLGGVALWGLSTRIGKTKDEKVDESGISGEEMQAGFVEGGVESEQLGAQDTSQNLNEGGLVLNLNEGGIVQQFNEGGVTQEFNQEGDNVTNLALNPPKQENNILNLLNPFSFMGGKENKPEKQNNILNFLNPMAWMGGQAQGAIDQADRGEGQFGGGLAGKMLEKRRALSEAQGFNKGGTVPGSGNKDTVPAMLTPGEFVMSKGAVQMFGTNTLASMNAAGGGNNKPTLTRGFNQGGVVQYLQKGGVVEPVGTPVLKSTSKVITLPTIPKQGQDIIPSTVDNPLPTFRIPIVSSHRSMVLSSLGIQDLIGA